MTKRFYFLAIWTLVLAPTAGTALPQTTESPRLILFVVVDQMRFDYLTRFDDIYSGGLRTLLDRGAVFSNARYRHALTQTGPGHSALMSGRHPRHSGIVANRLVGPVVEEDSQRRR